MKEVDEKLMDRRRSVAASYTLIQDQVSKEVLAGLEELMPLALDGTLTGFVFGGILRGRKFFVSCTGSAFADPTLARGVTLAIDDELQTMVHSRVDRTTTMF